VTAELFHLGVRAASQLVRNREVSPVEIVEAFLGRIALLDPIIFSYITVVAEQARAAALQAEAEIMRGRWRGPLHGLPYGLKDNFYTAGIRTTAASRLLLDFVPDVDATAHRKLQDAGAILLGKLNTYEYGTGTGAVHFDLPFPAARNPWNTTHFTGGSSTGAGAAIAAGTAMFALGTDTGGSVRLPASGCGVSGLKPTYGRVSRAGIQPNCWTLDHVGPLAWSVDDLAAILQVIAGRDSNDPASADQALPDYSMALGQGLTGLRIGVVRRFHEQDVSSAPEVAKAFNDALGALRDAGAELVELNLEFGLQDFRNCSRIINVSESFSIHEREFHEQHAKMGRALREKMSAGLFVRAADYLRAQRWRRELAIAVEQLFASCDVVICAGSPHPAPRFDDEEAVVRFTTESAMAVFNISGHPALAVCSGFSRNGMPLNIQFAARHWDEPTLLRVGSAFERATPWRQRRPNCGTAVNERSQGEQTC